MPLLALYQDGSVVGTSLSSQCGVNLYVCYLQHVYVLWCVVKDRYGDQTGDTDSDSSESSSDDCEGVSLNLPRPLSSSSDDKGSCLNVLSFL